jgi:hypothetical protein
MHGVDLGKVHEAALFYLPSHRPDGFLAHFAQNRKPLDPREWVKLIADDLLTSPPPPAPAAVVGETIGTVWRAEGGVSEKDKPIERAIAYWRQRGSVKGRGGRSSGC